MSRSTGHMLAWILLGFLWVYNLYVSTNTHMTVLIYLSWFMIGFCFVRAYMFYRLPIELEEKPEEKPEDKPE